MPYSETWANLRDISGATTPAAQIDDKFRARFLGLEERLESVLIQDVTADPWVLKDSALGKATGKVLVIPHTLFQELTSVDAPSANWQTAAFTAFKGSFAGGNNTGVMQAPIILPPGVTVTLVEILVNVIAGSIVWRFFRTPFASPHTETNIANGTYSTAGEGIITTAVLSEAIVGTNVYHLSVEVSGVDVSFGVFGARVTYNTPSSSQTY